MNILKTNIDALLNYAILKYGKLKIFSDYINNQKLLSKVPKIARIIIFKRIYISRKHKLILFLISKNANTTIKDALNLNLEKKNSDNYILSKLLTNNFKDFKKAIFLRDPFERFKSVYFDKILNSANKNYHFNSIEDFIAKLQKRKFIFTNQHWLPQENYLLRNICYFNFIGKVENLNNDLSRLFSIINVKKKIPFKKLNSSEILKKKNKDKLVILNRFKKKIYEIYKNDYQYWKEL